MRYLIILLLITSCGKDPSGSESQSAPEATNLVLKTESIEMVVARCDWDKDCRESCINDFVACVEPCGGQNTSRQIMLQNPGWEKCQDDCQANANACYAKETQISKEAYDRIVN